MPNAFALFMILIWPLVSYRIVKKYAVHTAVILALLIPYLFLPDKTGFDYPLVPPIDKSTLPPLVLALFLYWKYKQAPTLPENVVVRRLLVLLFIFPIFTVFTNKDTLFYGDTVLSALPNSDIIQNLFFNYSLIFIPFALGYKFLNSELHHRKFLQIVVVLGLAYSILMAWEIRMSPNLHTDIYGFFPHKFAQQKRMGGFRPVVFLGHGLLVAMFAVMVFFAAVTLLKNKAFPVKKAAFALTVYLAIIVVLCKTMSAYIYVLLFLPALMFMSKRMQLRLAALAVICVFMYPIIRASIVDIDKTYEFVEKIDEERAKSLRYRLRNEEILLEKANSKKFFGWGKWGRNRVYDPVTGEDLSTTDGFWIIVLGQNGWLSYVSIFGIYCFPIIALYLRSKRDKEFELSPYTSCLAVILAANLIDLIPNSSTSFLLPLIAGAILGVVDNKDTNKDSELPEQSA